MEMKQGQTANGATPSDTEGEPHMTIGEMAREFNVSLRTLRFYEDRGLLHPLRNGVTRLYPTRDRLHLQLILRGRHLGFTLSEIATLLSDQDLSGEGARLKLAPDQIRAQIRHLERQRETLDAAIAELRLAEIQLTQTPS
ncbi:MAG: MerR family DNA-binding transcriptional regulator [Methylovirgula sp.]|uniref:MerR family transcriptional regulator n=1 Tax=Methylovirgula sp. TaxID=1978224 RepID=UPI0030760C84